MSESIAKLLFVGDIHLGRRPSGAIDQLGEYGLDPGQLGPARAFETTVSLALRERVDAVVLAGDVIESERDRFEAYPHLEQGTRRLVEAGIRVYGVAGNHDALALPRLAKRIPGFELIGAAGVWETRTLETTSGQVVDLAGWSFTQNHYDSNPFQHPSWRELEPRLRRASNPVIGVVHGDLDASNSLYAPIRFTDLESAPTDAFFLGHVHLPSDLEAARPLGYLGSLVGLDPGEHGARGPWMVVVRGRGRVQARQISVGPIRWERLMVSVDGLGAGEIADGLHERIHEAFARRHAELDTELYPHVRAVGCRVELAGRSTDRAAIANFLVERRSRPLVREMRGVIFFLEKLLDRTEVAVDLARLSETQSPLGLLARERLDLDGPKGEQSELTKRLTREIEEVWSKHWAHLGAITRPPDARSLLRLVGDQLLSEMVESHPRRGDLEEPR